MLSGCRRQPGKLQASKTITLGDKPCAPHGGLCKLSSHNGELGAGLRIVKSDQNFALVDEISFLDCDLADNAAVSMLDGLEVLVDVDRTGRNDGAGQLRGRSPAARAHDEKQAEVRDPQRCDPRAENRRHPRRSHCASVLWPVWC